MRLAVVGAVAACAGAETVTPVEKVIELLKNLAAKTTAEGKKDAAAYDKYACFCKEQADDKLYAIEKSRKKIGKLDAKINELTGEVAELNTQISDLSVTISDHEAEIKTITEAADTAHAGYVEQAKELDGCISALGRAMKAMEDSKKGQTGDSDVDLVQIRKGSNLLKPDAKVTVLAALQKLSKPGEAHAYTYQSNDIIATLQDLLITFKENKKELDEEEFSRNSAFEKKRLAFQNEKKFAEKDKAEREAIVEAKNEELKAQQKEQGDETAAKGADQNFLEVLTEDCQTKANEWDARSSMRADELKTLNEAITTLKDGAQENYGANKKLSGIQQHSVVTKMQGHWEWVEGPKVVSFLQVRNNNAAPQKAIQLLTQQAAKLRSDVLSAAVMKMTVSLSQDHFVKVRAVIKDLISRLEDAAEAEATTKSFCDQGMSEATASRDEANGIIEDKSAEIRVAESEVNLLKEEISALEKGIADNMKALNEATELRNAEKADNEKTIEDATAGHEAVDFAITTLQQFYEKSEFLQQKKATYVPPNADRSGNTVGDLAPEVMSVSDDRAQAASKGIIGLLDVILSDFERTLEKVRQDESTAQAGFETMEADTKSDNEAKQADIDSKETRLSELSDEIIEHTQDKKDGQQQLKESKKKLSELKPMCVEGEETYEARVQKRQKEIEALKEAQKLLDEWQQ